VMWLTLGQLNEASRLHVTRRQPCACANCRTRNRRRPAGRRRATAGRRGRVPGVIGQIVGHVVVEQERHC
jgi:hypothetical protein